MPPVMQLAAGRLRKMMYKLERRVNGEWYVWGVYDDPAKLAHAAHEVGVYGYKMIRITEVSNEA